MNENPEEPKNLGDVIREMGGIAAVVEMEAERRRRVATATRHANFEEMCVIDPDLKKLFDQVPVIMGIDSNPWRSWSIVKRRMCELVGHTAIKPELTNDYDLAYRALFEEAQRVCLEL